MGAKSSSDSQEGTHSPSLGNPPFYGPYSLINADQGVRGFLHVVNDVCFRMASKMDLRSWNLPSNRPASDAATVTEAIKSLSNHKSAVSLQEIAQGLSTFDWRTSATPDLSESDRQRQSVFRGSGGYKELRWVLLRHLADENGEIGAVAKQLREAA
jgi:hypothetical protein